MALQQKLQKCMLFRRGMPAWARRYLIKRGNDLNDEATSVTVIQVWNACSDDINPAFEARKKVMGWKGAAFTQQKLNELKLELAQSLFEGCFDSTSMRMASMLF